MNLPLLRQLSENLFIFTDTCHSYLLRDGDAALLIDCGDCGILDALPGIGVRQIEWVLFTHHHRENCQGIGRLIQHGARVAVPRAEREFFENPLSFRTMQPQNDSPFTCLGSSYVRPLREPVKVNRDFGAMDEFDWRGHEFWALFTPGNSPGAMSYLCRYENEWLAFTGDLMLAGATLHTWYDSEWDYGYGAGINALYNSAFAIQRFSPRRMFPSHGPIIENPTEQLAQFQNKLQRFRPLYVRDWNMEFSVQSADNLSQPSAVPHVWQITPHLYKFDGSGFGGNFQMLLADSGHALFIDCGGWEVPWLDRRIELMKERLGLQQIDAIIVTHMHGDHLLQCPHLRDSQGAEVWTLAMVRETCEHPERFEYSAPITAYSGHEAVPIDRVFQRGEVLEWEGFSLTFDWLPGQTKFALVLHGEIDGKLVAFTGDNIFRCDEASGHDAVVAHAGGVLEEGYLYTAEYLNRLQPDLILAGHSVVIDQPKAQLQRYFQWTHEIRAAFQELSSEENYGYFYDPYWLQAYPYRSEATAESDVKLQVSVRNYSSSTESHSIKVKVPLGWKAVPSTIKAEVSGGQKVSHEIRVEVPEATPNGLYLLTFDVTRDCERLGEMFDAIINVVSQ